MISINIINLRRRLLEYCRNGNRVRIKSVDGGDRVVYVRGFADASSDILLISETSDSAAKRIMEIKNIQGVECVDK
jgi:hypothetical protein